MKIIFSKNQISCLSSFLSSVECVSNSVLYLDNHLGGYLFHKIPNAQRSQVHLVNSSPLIVQSGTLFRED